MVSFAGDELVVGAIIFAILVYESLPASLENKNLHLGSLAAVCVAVLLLNGRAFAHSNPNQWLNFHEQNRLALKYFHDQGYRNVVIFTAVTASYDLRIFMQEIFGIDPYLVNRTHMYRDVSTLLADINKKDIELIYFVPYKDSTADHAFVELAAEKAGDWEQLDIPPAIANKGITQAYAVSKVRFTRERNNAANGGQQ